MTPPHNSDDDREFRALGLMLLLAAVVWSIFNARCVL